MAERTLAQNVAQAIADFKAIKDIVNEATSGDANIPDGTPTSQYAEKIDQTFSKVFSQGESMGDEAGYNRGYEEGYTAGTEEGGNNEEIYQEGFEAGYKDGVGAAEATVSGETIRVDDVVDIEHPLNITVQSKNLFDVNKINTESATINNDGTFSVIGHPSGIGVLGAMCPLLKEGDTIVVNWDGTTNDALYLYELKSYISKKTPTVITNEMLRSRVGIYANRVDGMLVNTVISNFQVELGETATAYAPYISDFSGVKVSRYGKNLLDTNTAELSGCEMQDGSILSNATASYVDIPLPAGEYTISFDKSVGETIVYLVNGKANSGYFSSTALNSISFKYDASYDGYLRIKWFNKNLVLSNFQIEKGNLKTDYEPCKGAQIAISNENGVIEGLSSIAPTMTFLTNIDGVRLNCSYLKSAVIENQLEAFKEGQKSEYDRFWDNYQEYGNRTVYANAFGSGWTAETFKPKYSIRPTNAYMMFYNNAGYKIRIDDFVEFCERQGIELDLSNSKYLTYALGCLRTKRFGVIDASKAVNTDYMFYSNTTLTTIDEFISSETTVYSTNTFSNATNLTNIIMSGVVATSISFYKNSKLTKASLDSIISVLKDFSGTSTTATLTLHADSKAKLSEADIAIATQKGWTVA